MWVKASQYPFVDAVASGEVVNDVGQVMFCIQRQEAPDQWVQELCFKTEFKAYMCARTKSQHMNTYHD